MADDDRLVALLRRGDTAAFEVLYERHSRGLLSFCVYVLGSTHDAEDAVQTTFTSAYRALRADDRPVALRPWLFTIARNNCLTIRRKRQPTVELNGEPALGGDPPRELELREEVRHMLEGLRELPENQRTALVLAEMHGLSQAEVGSILGIAPEQVKAYVYQARSNLISARRAREADCREIREELATARGAGLRRGRLRRHVRSCADCRLYADSVARQRRQYAAILPLVPPLLLKYRVLEEALGIGGADPATYAGGATLGGSVAGAAVEIAGGGVKALAVKMAAGVALLGASAGVGASVIGIPIAPRETTPPAASRAQSGRSSPLASVGRVDTVGWTPSGAATQVAGPTQAGAQGDEQPTPPTQTGTPAAGSDGLPQAGVTSPGNTSKSPDGGGDVGQEGEQGRPPKTGEQEANEEARQKESAEDQHQSEEHQRKRDEQQQKSEAHKQKVEEHQRQRQQRKQELEEHQHQRQERKQQREERPVGVSRPPKTEEELRKKREKREQRRKERQEQKQSKE